MGPMIRIFRSALTIGSQCFKQTQKRCISISLIQAAAGEKFAMLDKQRSAYYNVLFTERRYTDKHEWISTEGAIGTVGISKYAQEALGDVVFAQLPDAGTTLKQHDECGALESVKAASEIYSPISGKVTEKNSAVEETPALINTDYYNKGWLFKLSISDPSEVEKLMTEEQYKKFLDAEDH